MAVGSGGFAAMRRSGGCTEKGEPVARRVRRAVGPTIGPTNGPTGTIRRTPGARRGPSGARQPG